MANESLGAGPEGAMGFLNSIFTSVFSNLVVTIIIILIGLVLGRIIGKLIQKILHEFELNKTLRKATGIRLSIEELIGNFITYFIYFIAAVMALNQIGLTTTVLNMISGAILLIIIISVVLAIKDFVPNILAGMFIHKKKLVNIGDIIKIKNVQGKVVHVNLVETRVRTMSGDLIHIPNSVFTKNELVKSIKLKPKRKKT